jgi:hypothetical protein
MISESGDDILRRCAWKLRRAWYWPLGLAIVFGATAYLVTETSYRSTIEFFAVSHSPTLEVAKISPSTISGLTTLAADMSDLETAASQLPAPRAHVALSDESTETLPRLRVVVSGPSRSVVAATRAKVTDAFIRSRMARLSTALRSAGQALEANRALLQAKIKELDSRLEQSKDLTGITGRLVERSQLGAALLDTEAKIEAVEQLSETPDELIQIGGREAARPEGGRTISSMAGALFGLVTGFGIVYGLAWRDRKVRSRRDVAAATDREVLAVIPAAGGEAAMRRLAGILSAILAAEGSESVDLVPAGPNVAVSTLASSLVAEPALKESVEIRGLAALDDDPEAFQADGPCVVVAAFARTEREDLQHTVDDIARSGRSVIGVLLVEVPTSVFKWANAGPAVSSTSGNGRFGMPGG